MKLKTKIMYGVEHQYCFDEVSSFEIFETLDEANTFLSGNLWGKNHKPLFIFKADFNKELIFREDDGKWNYEDYSNLILGNYKIVKPVD